AGGEAGGPAERSPHQGARAAADAGSGAALLRARAADRMAAGGARPLPRQENRGWPLPRVDPRDGAAAGRARDPSMRARLRLRHAAARLGADPPWAHRVRADADGGEPRPRALVSPPVSRRRLAALRPR